MTIRPIFYPIQGIFYFTSHPNLWKSCLKGLLFTILFGISVLIALCFLVKPTNNFLVNHGWPNWLAYISAIIFLFVESGIAVILFGLMIIPILLDEVFEKVLKLKGLEYKVLKPSKIDSSFIRATISSVLFGVTQFIVLIATLPLHLLPIFGTILYCCINGYFLAWGYMMPDLIGLRKFSFSESRAYVSKKRSSFISFGAIACALELIPLFNWIFIFTNAIGAGLWASDEWKKILKERGTLRTKSKIQD